MWYTVVGKKGGKQVECACEWMYLWSCRPSNGCLLGFNLGSVTLTIEHAHRESHIIAHYHLFHSARPNREDWLTHTHTHTSHSPAVLDSASWQLHFWDGMDGHSTNVRECAHKYRKNTKYIALLNQHKRQLYWRLASRVHWAHWSWQNRDNRVYRKHTHREWWQENKNSSSSIFEFNIWSVQELASSFVCLFAGSEVN